MEAVQHGAQPIEDLPVWMEYSDGAERIKGNGGVEKTLSTRFTKEHGKRWKEGLEIMLNGR